MNIPPQRTHALRDVPDGVPGLFMRHPTRQQRAPAEALAGAERSTRPARDAFANLAAAPFGKAGGSVLIAILAPPRGTPPIQSP